MGKGADARQPRIPSTRKTALRTTPIPFCQTPTASAVRLRLLVVDLAFRVSVLFVLYARVVLTATNIAAPNDEACSRNTVRAHGGDYMSRYP